MIQGNVSNRRGSVRSARRPSLWLWLAWGLASGGVAVASCAPGKGDGNGAGGGTGSTNGVGGAGVSGNGPLSSSGSGPLGPISLPDGAPIDDYGTGGYFNPDAEVICIPQEPPAPPPVVPFSQDDCPGPVDAGTAQALRAGGSAAGMRWLYPYDGTVFPIGLPPPALQWEQPGSASAVYVHLKSSMFEYWGCFSSNAQNRLTIPQAIWDEAEKMTQGGADPLTVELSVMNGGTVVGPLTATWYIANGKLQGQLFYNTYTSPLAQQPPPAGAGAPNGAVMRLHLGAPQPEVLLTQQGAAPLGPCWSCHSLGAQGTMLVAQSHLYPAGPFISASFDLVANPSLQPPPLAQPTDFELGLGAVYPDGSKVLTMGSPALSNESLFFPYGRGNIPAMIGPRESALLDTRTGNRITVNGWNVQYAKMPSFSPDGSRVAFNWHDTGNGHTLGVAEFDTNTNTMSNTREIFRHDTLFPGWPFITPDNKEVIFVLGNTDDYVSSIPFARPDRPVMASSELWIVDIDTGQARPLARANGYPQAGAGTYLPRAGRDEHLEFFPTISPVGSGGYFWLFFTSRRTYGNTITQVSEDPITKKIWVSAINIRAPGAPPIADPSYPAFYLPGQEAAAGNIRAFAALEPCRQDGDDCETGIDCCTGQCSNGKCGPPQPPPPQCMQAPPPPPTCRNLDERCNTKSDCCNDRAECIGHYCTIIIPPR